MTSLRRILTSTTSLTTTTTTTAGALAARQHSFVGSRQRRLFSQSPAVPFWGRSGWWPGSTAAAKALDGVGGVGGGVGGGVTSTSTLSLNAQLAQDAAATATAATATTATTTSTTSAAPPAQATLADYFVIPNHSISDGDDAGLASLKDSFICRPEESAWHISQIQDGLAFVHGELGLPWWASIMVVTWSVRTLLLPLNLSLVRNSARLNAIRPQLEYHNGKLRDPTLSEQERFLVAEKTTALFKENRCSPFRNLLSPILMTPVFLSL